MAYDPSSTEGLPEAGAARLEQNRSGLFTSDLSVNEFLLVRQAGFQPLGLVIGSSIYHIGYQQAQWKQSQEMQVLSQAMYEARELAICEGELDAMSSYIYGIPAVSVPFGGGGGACTGSRTGDSGPAYRP